MAYFTCCLPADQVTTRQRKNHHDKARYDDIHSIISGQSLHSQVYSKKSAWQSLQTDNNYWLVKIEKLAQVSFSSSTPSSDLHTKICSIHLPEGNKLVKLEAEPLIPNEEHSTDTVLSLKSLASLLVPDAMSLCHIAPSLPINSSIQPVTLFLNHRFATFKEKK